MAYSLPKTASAVNGTEWLQALDDAVEISEGLFYGTSAPAHKNGRRWLDTTTGVKLKVSIAAAWVTLLDDATVAGGGLVRAVAGAFTTLAPTSAVAAAAASDLVRKNEADARTLTAMYPLGTISATGTHNIFVTPQAGTTIVDVGLIVTTTVAIDATNYWGVRIYDPAAALSLISGTVGPPPTGSLLTASSFSPGGTAFTANTQRASGVNQNNTGLAAGKVIQLELTKYAAAANLVNLVAAVKYRVTT